MAENLLGFKCGDIFSSTGSLNTKNIYKPALSEYITSPPRWPNLNSSSSSENSDNLSWRDNSDFEDSDSSIYMPKGHCFPSWPMDDSCCGTSSYSIDEDRSSLNEDSIFLDDDEDDDDDDYSQSEKSNLSESIKETIPLTNTRNTMSQKNNLDSFKSEINNNKVIESPYIVTTALMPQVSENTKMSPDKMREEIDNNGIETEESKGRSRMWCYAKSRLDIEIQNLEEYIHSMELHIPMLKSLLDNLKSLKTSGQMHKLEQADEIFFLPYVNVAPHSTRERKKADIRPFDKKGKDLKIHVLEPKTFFDKNMPETDITLSIKNEENIKKKQVSNQDRLDYGETSSLINKWQFDYPHICLTPSCEQCSAFCQEKISPSQYISVNSEKPLQGKVETLGSKDHGCCVMPPDSVLQNTRTVKKGKKKKKNYSNPCGKYNDRQKRYFTMSTGNKGKCFNRRSTQKSSVIPVQQDERPNERRLSLRSYNKSFNTSTPKPNIQVKDPSITEPDFIKIVSSPRYKLRTRSKQHSL